MGSRAGRADGIGPTTAYTWRPPVVPLEGRRSKEVRVITGHISTKAGGGVEILAVDTEDCYLAELIELLKLETDRRVRELAAMSDEALFGSRALG